jgi:hypothetical protein
MVEAQIRVIARRREAKAFALLRLATCFSGLAR